MSLGFEQAGFDIVAAVEIDPIHCAVHEFNFPNCAVICQSVTELDGETLRKRAGLGSASPDVIFGGAPCQGFSLIGKRALDDPRNALVGHFVRLVKELSPKYFVFENVAGLTAGEHKQFLFELIDSLKSAGYDVVLPYRVLNALDFGVPQHRRRLFLMGCKSGERLPTYPESSHTPASEPTNGLPAGPTVWEAIGDLPEADRFAELLERDWVRGRHKKPSAYAAGLRSSAGDVGVLGPPREFDVGVLTSSMRTVHSELSMRRFAETPHGDTEPVSRFLKLAPDGVCNTLRAGTGSERGAFTSPRPIHPFTPRCITVREAARLHSYPDWFRFHATKWHGFRQIGNSVPPRLARAIATRIRVALGRTVLPSGGPVELGDPELLHMTMHECARRYGVRSDVVGRRLPPVTDTTESAMSSRYERILVELFRRFLKKGSDGFAFERDELIRIANEIGIATPKNLGDVLYSFRYRVDLPDEITRAAGDGMTWAILGTGKGIYLIKRVRLTRILPREGMATVKVPDATPEIVAARALGDEQALLAKLRYNRLIDLFLGINAYSLQNHLRSTVPDMGQIEIDELYVGVHKSGTQFVIPVQAKGGADQLAANQTLQDVEFCRVRYPDLICRPVSAQFLPDKRIAIFELVIQDGEVRIADERHFELVAAGAITPEELRTYASRLGEAPRGE
jgi:DNA (cytosine-5)-methyltransferase 1